MEARERSEREEQEGAEQKREEAREEAGGARREAKEGPREGTAEATEEEGPVGAPVPAKGRPRRCPRSDGAWRGGRGLRRPAAAAPAATPAPYRGLAEGGARRPEGLRGAPSRCRRPSATTRGPSRGRGGAAACCRRRTPLPARPLPVAAARRSAGESVLGSVACVRGQ